jgi:cellulose biosynthesis protein BcsQ
MLIRSDRHGIGRKPGNLRFPVYEVALADQTVGSWVREMNRVAAKYDYIVVDTAPSARALGTAIAVCHTIVVPCTPSGLDLEATVETVDIINQTRAHRRGLPGVVLVPNRVDARTLSKASNLSRNWQASAMLSAPQLATDRPLSVPLHLVVRFLKWRKGKSAIKKFSCYALSSKAHCSAV